MKRTLLLGGVGAIAALGLVGAGFSYGTSADGAEPARAPAQSQPLDTDVSGTWKGTALLVRADGTRGNRTRTFTFSRYAAGTFRVRQVNRTPDGRTLRTAGLGAIAPNGTLSIVLFGEAVRAEGYLQDERTMVLRILEADEVGEEVPGLRREGFATVVTLRRT